MKDIGLVVEGGGMRGVYTAGVLDFFMEKNLYFNDCYAVSAGACHVTSYVSKQIGRSMKITLDYINDKRYCSLRSLIKTGDLFGAEMLYDIIPKQILNNIEKILGGDLSEIPEEIQKEYVVKLRCIPFSSLGKQNGLLLGMKAEEITIIIDDEKKIKQNVIIGIYEKSLTKRGEYRALVGLDLI